MVPLPLDEKAALPQPPEMQVVWVIPRRENIREKIIVPEKWLNHGPGSKYTWLRTVSNHERNRWWGMKRET